MNIPLEVVSTAPLCHQQLITYLKESLVASETEIHLEDNAAATPRTPFPSEEDAFSRKRREGVVPGVEAEVNSSHHTDQLEHVQHQHQDQDQDQDQEQKQDPKQDPKQDQDQLTILTSLNKQTTSRIQTYSQSQSKSEDGGDTNVLEQALVLGQVALVLVSSLIAVSATSGDDRVECRLAAHSKAQTEAQAQTQAQAQREAAVALKNMGVALVKQFDRTGDRRDLEEARGDTCQGWRL